MSQKPSDMPEQDSGEPGRSPERPRRWTVTDELGRKRTLAALETDYLLRNGGGLTVVFGLGPDPELTARLVPQGLPVAYVERPDCPWPAPEGWLRIQPEELTPDAFRLPNLLIWKPGETLWPSFWGPIMARMRVARLGDPPARGERRLVWIGCLHNSMIVRELESAFAQLGWRTRLVGEMSPWSLDPLESALTGLREERPDLFLGVNLHGLDDGGKVAGVLAEAGCRVTTWFVDNPFHLLSSKRTAFWRDVHSFVTDATLIDLLRAHGMKRVEHLPLASWSGFKPNCPTPENLSGRVVFVGRSEFRDKKLFFSATSIPKDLLTEAVASLRTGQRPDYHWWIHRLGVTELWPSHAGRRPGLGAQETGSAWRAMCLDAAASTGLLTVFGDEGWSSLLDRRTDLFGIVDYYRDLPVIYAGSGCVLNITGMILPAGLTQRHFDVWEVGNCLVTDANPGLDIFPADLTREIVFRTPDEIPDLCARLSDSTNPRRAELITAWRELIRNEHNYRHRAEHILMSAGLA